MVVFVRYGADQKVLVNTDCSPYVLMSWLHSVCNLSLKSNIHLDLTDDQGDLQHILSIKEHASSKLVDRAEYILVKVQKNKNMLTVTPLLDNWKPTMVNEQSADTITKRKFSRGSARKVSMQY